MKAFADNAPCARRLRRLLPVAALAVPLMALGPAGAEDKPHPVSTRYELGEVVSMAGCRVVVTDSQLLNEPEPRIAVDVSIAEVEAGSPGRCHRFFHRGEDGQLNPAAVATSSLSLDRAVSTSPVASARFVFEPHAGPADIVFAPGLADGDQAVWTVRNA